MATKNDITGDAIKTKGGATESYRDGWDRIFGKKAKVIDDDDAHNQVLLEIGDLNDDDDWELYRAEVLLKDELGVPEGQQRES